MMKKTLLTASLTLISYLLQAQSVCEDVHRGVHLQIISKEFNDLPSNPILDTVEKRYFPLTSVLTCFFLLQSNITNEQETRVVYQRVRDIAVKYIQTDTLILLTDYYNSGKVTEIFNGFASKYRLRYISMGGDCCGGKVWEAMEYFNQQMECHLIDINGKDWKKQFYADLEAYYNEQLSQMSRKERKKIIKNNY
ncbi:hypothetical protein Q0590_11415 [Rhodocytophaga aerolata]|uniref:Uncharacterized protein n=1 Tax=Rhodocytophaga aerolata TaxID=455078 RepID=A0ABT8R436_9BACT|nr:hypothetical protein [Rhodocytophaga aerolata]MDO1446866.1 hypothetical protein [Rhodocytophaga aerolata]